MLLLTLAALTASTPAQASSIEEPLWRQELAADEFEIRIVEPYVVAEVTVDGPRERADGEAFRLLFGYISGRNQGSRRIEMTAPVTSVAAGASGGVKIDMTAPVTRRAVTAVGTGGSVGATISGGSAGATTPGSDADGPERYVVQFVLPPSLYTRLNDAPLPSDARVRLRELPRHRLAVWRYRGSWSEANTAEKIERLRAALAARGITPPQPEAAPVLARYDPPLVPWFLRRNEVWIDLGPVAEGAPPSR